MAKNSVTTILRGLINLWYGQAKKKKHTRTIMMVLAFLFSSSTIFFGYRTYVVYKERNAQKLFGDYFDVYQKMAHGESDDWNKVEQLFKDGYQNVSCSNIAPYFSLFYIEALIQQKKTQEALTEFETLIQQSVSSPFLGLFKTKHALLIIDSDDQDVQKKGLELLQTLSQDSNNNYKDFAQYYLGLYHWVNDNIEQAQSVWNTLLVEQNMHKLSPSPWVEIVKEKLERIV